MGINAPLNRKLRMALVGGGAGSFIGRVHSIAACLDNRAVVTAGALSSDPQRAKASAPDYDIADSRAYGSYEAMLDAESKLPEGERIDFVSVATPNHMHFDVARAAVEAGFNVVCDKPMTFDLAQAESLLKTVEGQRRRVCGDPQLHRLSAGAAGPRDDSGWRAGRNQRDSLAIHPGLAANCAGRATTKNRPLGGPTRPRAAPPAPSVTSPRMPTTSAAT